MARNNLLYQAFKNQQKEPSFLDSLQGNIGSFQKSTEGIPKSLYELLINKRMGFNVGDKGYLNLRFPRSRQKFDLGEDEFGIDFTYDF